MFVMFRNFAIALLLVSVPFAASSQIVTDEERNAEWQKKVRTLSGAEAARWVSALENTRTKDGSTVLDVLTYAMIQSPFRFFDIGVGYNGASGLPTSVGVEYWLSVGTNSPSTDSHGLGFAVQLDGERLTFSPDLNDELGVAVMEGKAAFLRAIELCVRRRCR
jgi:hypothetical protein